MLKIITSLSMFLLGTMAQAQVSESRDMNQFSKIDVSKGVEIIYTQDNTNTLTAEAQDAALLKDLITEVKNNTLYIYTAGKTNASFKVRISASGINAIKMDRKSRFTITNQLRASNLDVSLNKSILSGSISADSLSLVANAGSVINSKITTEMLSASFRNKSVVLLSGIAREGHFTGNTAALCNASELACKKTAIIADGYSKVFANAREEISVVVTDGAQVNYTGLPLKAQLPLNANISVKNSSAITKL